MDLNSIFMLSLISCAYIIGLCSFVQVLSPIFLFQFSFILFISQKSEDGVDIDDEDEEGGLSSIYAQSG